MRIIAGTYRGRQLRTTSGPGYRPATGKVRESVFSMLEARGLDWEGTRVADIFAGSGSLGIEALSRGATHAVFVEKAPQAAALVRANLEALETERTRWQVVRGDALRWLATPGLPSCGLIFIDPPYGQNLLLPTLQLVVNGGLLADEGLLCVEVEAGLALPDPVHPELELVRDKLYGQTRICIWGRK